MGLLLALWVSPACFFAFFGFPFHVFNVPHVLRMACDLNHKHKHILKLILHSRYSDTLRCESGPGGAKHTRKLLLAARLGQADIHSSLCAETVCRKESKL
jgi:hypothetical protein